MKLPKQFKVQIEQEVHDEVAEEATEIAEPTSKFVPNSQRGVKVGNAGKVHNSKTTTPKSLQPRKRGAS